MGKQQTHSKTPQTRAKRAVLSQQVTTRHKETGAYKGIANTEQKKNIHKRSSALERSVKYSTGLTVHQTLEGLFQLEGTRVIHLDPLLYVDGELIAYYSILIYG